MFDSNISLKFSRLRCQVCLRSKHYTNISISTIIPIIIYVCQEHIQNQYLKTYFVCSWHNISFRYWGISMISSQVVAFGTSFMGEEILKLLNFNYDYDFHCENARPLETLFSSRFTVTCAIHTFISVL